MQTIRFRLGFFALIILVAAFAAQGQATRTWVSGVGDDVNPCSRTAPCKTFAGAISKTAAGGIIDALDPGGFGAVTITKAITLEGNGTLASILASGGNGVVVNITSGVGRNVILRNLLIDGSGPVIGTNGVRFIAGDSLLVEDCYVHNFTTTGVDFENDTGIGVVEVRRTSISATGVGVLVKPQAAATAARAAIQDSMITKCSTGVRAEDKSNANIDRSSISGNVDGVLSFAATGTGTIVVVVGTQIVGNTGAGLKTSGGASALRLSASSVTGNALGVDHSLGGELSTYVNNVFTGNTSNGTFTGNTSPGLS